MWNSNIFKLLLLSNVGLSSAFTTPMPRTTYNSKISSPAATSMNMNTPSEEEDQVSSSSMSRRKVFTDAVAMTTAAASFSLFNPSIVLAEGAENGGIGSDPSKPIAIIGAGGKCGTLCTDILSKKQLYSRAITRSGRQILDKESNFVSYASGDVTNYEALKKVIENSSGVIFAASASGKKKGGDPEHVDYLGLYNTARACIECNVPKLVVISAGSITRPDFVGFKATNLFVKYVYGDKIMDYKIAGESVMRDLYAKNQSNNSAYCVVRPGGLSDASSEGPGAIHVSQGDVYSAEITRQDVAEVSVAALLKGKATDFATFELNNQKGMSKVSKDLETPPAQLVHAGAASYDALLDGLLTDNELKASYPQYLNDFRGDGIKPISQVV